MKNKSLISISLVLVVVLFIIAGFIYENNKTNKINSFTSKNEQPFVRNNSVFIGNKDAKITIVEFFDPECPACAVFHPIVNAAFKEYFPNIKIVYRYLANHKYSKYAIKIIEAARKQGKYKQALEIVLKTQQFWADSQDLRPELIWQYLANSDIDMKQLKKDFLKINIDIILKQAREDANKLNITGTPTLFVNGKELKELSYKALFDLVENEILKEGTK